MAREKYNPELLLETLSDPALWVHRDDANGEEHHTPRSLAAVIPPDAKFLD